MLQGNRTNSPCLEKQSISASAGGHPLFNQIIRDLAQQKELIQAAHRNYEVLPCGRLSGICLFKLSGRVGIIRPCNFQKVTERLIEALFAGLKIFAQAIFNLVVCEHLRFFETAERSIYLRVTKKT
jgi:hypothetical protein